MALMRWPAVATAHALGVLLLGLHWAVRAPTWHRVAAVLAYIAGAEVLWRMTESAPVYEYGKYASVAIMLLALLRSRARLRLLPTLYLLLLLPSSVFTLQGAPFHIAREQISFNLSGPLALALAVTFFANVSMTRRDVVALALTLCGPIAAIAAISVVATSGLDPSAFQGESVHAVAAGFGPNQVSSVLGLGVLAGFLLLLSRLLPLRLVWVTVALTAVFATQSILTFSRGGVALALGSIAAGSLPLVRPRRSRTQLALYLSGFALVFALVVWPAVSEFTGGRVDARYRDTTTSGRMDIVRADLETWQHNFWLGVGPGMTLVHRLSLGWGASAHTEFTRLLAEHGVLGLLALACLLLLALGSARVRSDAFARGTVIAFLTWALLFMSINAMRTVAPAFVFGLACAVIRPWERPEASPPS